MAFLSHKKREIRAKIVYYGPGLSGKTSNVEYIYKKMRSDHRGELLNLSTNERTIFFDFLPVELGNIKGYKTSFHIFTVPGQVFYNETRKAVLNEVDGVVFVADSCKKSRDENVRSLKNLEENLAAYGKRLPDLPHVFQYNKRDMPDVMSVEELHLLLNKTGAPFFEAVATDGTGVLNTLKLISKIVLKKLASPGASIKEIEDDFEEDNYGLSSEYVALKPGENAPASVKAVTTMQFEVPLEEPAREDVKETVEKPAKETLKEAALPLPLNEVKIGNASAEIIKVAKISKEPVGEAEIHELVHGTEWTPTPEDEAGAIEEPPIAEPVAEPAASEPPAAEIIDEKSEPIAISKWEVKEPANAQPAANPVATTAANPQPAQDVGGKEIDLYQWGFPEKLNVNTIRVPVFFRDRDTGQEFWSYLTITLDHIYKR